MKFTDADIQANTFARELLMPEREFEERVFENRDMLFLAETFQVPLMAVRVRAGELAITLD
jgi:Zn-dependent peptidase ImmA (M78 family)